MIKAMALVVVLLSLSGCGWFARETAKLTGYSVVCVTGISYVQFASGVALLVDASGKPVVCE